MEKIEGRQDVSFGDYRLKLHERQLEGPNGVVELSARAFDIIWLLVSHPHEIVAKSTIFDTVWPAVVVEDNTLQAHISALRKSLAPDYIVTVHGRGYKYVGPMPYPAGSPTESGERDLDASGNGASDAAVATAALRLSDRPSIAVMPLENLSGD